MNGKQFFCSEEMLHKARTYCDELRYIIFLWEFDMMIFNFCSFSSYIILHFLHFFSLFHMINSSNFSLFLWDFFMSKFLFFWYQRFSSKVGQIKWKAVFIIIVASKLSKNRVNFMKKVKIKIDTWWFALDLKLQKDFFHSIWINILSRYYKAKRPFIKDVRWKFVPSVQRF